MKQAGFMPHHFLRTILPMTRLKEVIPKGIKKPRPWSCLGILKCALLWFAVNNTHTNQYTPIKRYKKMQKKYQKD